MTVLTRRETSVLLNFTSLWTGRLVACRLRDMCSLNRWKVKRLLRGGGGLRGFRALHTVLGTADAAFFNAGGVECAPDNVVADAGQILHPATAHQHDGVFLQIVAFIGNVGDDFKAVGQ